jgi:hypothetical protein
MDFCAQEAPPLVKSQRGAVLGYLHGGRWTLVREFVDVNDFNDIAGAPIEQSVALAGRPPIRVRPLGRDKVAVLCASWRSRHAAKVCVARAVMRFLKGWIRAVR